MPTWIKRGHLFGSEQHWPKNYTHASNPVALPLDDQSCRFFFSSRDSKRRAHIFWADIQLFPEPKILRTAPHPVLEPGELGLFDDSGVSLSCIVRDDEDNLLLYYLGWNLGVTVPWRNSIGLAKWDTTSETFKKISPAPVFDRNPIDPYSISYPFVMRDGDIWKMWYGSNLRWGSEQRDMDHVIKYAESKDGVSWQPSGKVVIGIQSPDEYAFSRPYVIKASDRYQMWYSFRGKTYRIGYAESTDGINWDRKDAQSGINVSGSGWESEAVCYPNLFEMGGFTYMVYNGNRYGEMGFGWAKLDPSKP